MGDIKHSAMKCEPAQFRLLHALCSDLARAYPAISARDWKNYLLTVAPQYIAESDGKPIPPRTKRASTLEMSVSEVNEAIAFIDWFSAGASIPVSFSHKD